MTKAAALKVELQMMLEEVKKTKRTKLAHGLTKALDTLALEEREQRTQRQHQLHQKIALASTELAFLEPRESDYSALPSMASKPMAAIRLNMEPARNRSLC